mmetsp:Transcript_58087/g.138287  ORF Transcript_58087/g.138287 Transcript_58087/m.138287 type:complete len:282 (+) Transcript_58087:60-905(+)
MCLLPDRVSECESERLLLSGTVQQPRRVPRQRRGVERAGALRRASARLHGRHRQPRQSQRQRAERPATVLCLEDPGVPQGPGGVASSLQHHHRRLRFGILGQPQRGRSCNFRHQGGFLLHGLSLQRPQPRQPPTQCLRWPAFSAGALGTGPCCRLAWPGRDRAGHQQIATAASEHQPVWPNIRGSHPHLPCPGKACRRSHEQADRELQCSWAPGQHRSGLPLRGVRLHPGESGRGAGNFAALPVDGLRRQQQQQRRQWPCGHGPLQPGPGAVPLRDRTPAH